MPQFVDFKGLTAHTMSADVSSDALYAADFVYWSALIKWTGSPTGNVSIQGSVDNVTWVDITGTVTACGGSSGSVTYDNQAPTALPYLRLHYAFTSGSGALTGIVFIKTGA